MATVSAKRSGDGVYIQPASIAQRATAAMRRGGAFLTNKAVLALLLSVVAGSSIAQPIAIHGWIDGYSAWNDKRPDSGLNFFDGVGTTAHRSDDLALNVAALEVVRAPKPFGFHVVLVTGDSTNIVHAFEPHPKRRLIRNVYQASASY